MPFSSDKQPLRGAIKLNFNSFNEIAKYTKLTLYKYTRD